MDSVTRLAGGREGVERLSDDKKADARRPGADESDNKKEGSAKRKQGAAPADVSRALKTAYDETLREDVPPDFLDLLGKLS